MKKFFKLFLEVTIEILLSVSYFIKVSLRYIGAAIYISIPYVMYFLGQHAYKATDKIGIDIGMALLPIAFIIVAFYFRTIADKLGTGNKVPVPDSRFTEVSNDGEVNVNNSRLQEMILYVADLEDWMERKGML